MKFEKINYLLGAYFHQDWYLDSENPDDIIRDFVNKETSETVHLLREQIDQLLASEHELTEDFIYGNNGYYDPKFDGLTVRQWFERILNQLD